MFKSRKSQAALEFLMTYGWAILVVLIVISALAYFGVLNPQRLLPSRCTLTTGYNCEFFVVRASATNPQLRVTIYNGAGNSIFVSKVSATPAAGNPTSPCEYTPTDPSKPNNLMSGNSISFNLSCTPLIDSSYANIDKKYRWDLKVQYYSEGSTVDYTKNLVGEIMTTIEQP